MALFFGVTSKKRSNTGFPILRSGDVYYLSLTVVLPIILTELVLFGCARSFANLKAYTWYSCALRVFAYSPCLIGASHGHGIMPMPVASAVLLRLRGGEGDIVWLYGIPEVFVGVCCYFVSFALRSNSAPEPDNAPAATDTNARNTQVSPHPGVGGVTRGRRGTSAGG